MTPTEQAQAFQHQPGQAGVLARLFLAWNPEKAQLWLAAEQARGTPPEQIAHAVAEVVAGTFVGILGMMPLQTDKIGFLNHMLLGKLERRLSAAPPPPGSGIIMPDGYNGGG